MSKEPIQILQAKFSDGVTYSLIMYPDGKYESLVNSDILTTHETLDDGLKFIKDWSEEMLKKSS